MHKEKIPHLLLYYLLLELLNKFFDPSIILVFCTCLIVIEVVQNKTPIKTRFTPHHIKGTKVFSNKRASILSMEIYTQLKSIKTIIPRENAIGKTSFV